MIVIMDRQTMDEVYGEDALVVYILKNGQESEHTTIFPILDK